METAIAFILGHAKHLNESVNWRPRAWHYSIVDVFIAAKRTKTEKVGACGSGAEYDPRSNDR